MSAEPSNPSRPRVLFVDDDPSVLGNIRRSLWREPLELLTAGSAADALTILQTEPIDVVVSDEKMPNMGGAELLTIVRERHPDVCRILLSGHADVDAALRAINDARVFRFLTKPCPPSTLAGCIHEALQGREDRRALERAVSAKRREDDERARFSEAIGRLWMAVQPIVRAESGTLYAYETLARCDHPSIDGPLALFELAARVGAVAELEVLLRQRIAELLRTLPPEVLLFVNVHPSSLCDPTFYLPENPLLATPERVVLELVEHGALAIDGGMLERVDRLRALGFRIAIDDLGSGYNGLNVFAEISPDLVKFDMALVREVDRSPTKRRLLAAMIGVCREFGIVTVAEGIETDAQAVQLRALGCDLLQGYLFGRPARFSIAS